MPLTPDQMDALRALDWLFDGERREGRTTVIAVALIRLALQYPGREVVYLDHYLWGSHETMVHLMSDQLRSMVLTDPELSQLNWVFSRNGFRLITPEITDTIPHNWLPYRDNPPPRVLSALKAEADRQEKPRSVWDRLRNADSV